MKKPTILFIVMLIICITKSYSQLDITDYSGVISTQHTPVSPSTSANQLIDNSASTYFSVAQASTWVTYKAYNPFCIKSYSVTSATTSATYDPKTWKLEASTNGITWVTLDNKTGQTFASRGLKKNFSIANTGLYNYYRFTFTNTTSQINLAECELQLSASWNNFVFPTISITTLGTNTTAGEAVFFQAINQARAKQVCLGVNTILYQLASEVPSFSKLNLIVDPNYTGISVKSGNPPEITIKFGANYLNSIYTNQNIDFVINEILGILYHEVTHAYTIEPNNSGAYSNNTNFHTFIEGIADYVRYKAGYIPLSNRQPSNWYSGYKPAAFYIDWLNTKNPNFSYLFNLSSRTISSWTWDKATRQILNKSNELLWKEYQVFLKNTGTNLIAEFGLNDTEIDTNTNVYFTNLSVNATSYSWSFPGGIPATSTSQNPVVSYPNIGVYPVTLTVSNGSTSVTKTYTSYVKAGLKNIAKICNLVTNNTPVSSENYFCATDEIPYTKLLQSDLPNTNIMMVCNSPIVLKTYVLQGNSLYDSPERFPSSWFLKASNDNINWTIIDTQTNQVHPSIDYGRIQYDLTNNSTAYTFYKIDTFTNLINGGASDYLALSEIEMYGTGYNSLNSDITDDGGLLSAQYQTDSPVNEDYKKVIDNSSTTKYFTNNCSAWIRYDAMKVYVPIRYSIVSGNDEPNRDPKNWTLQGSNDGVDWTVIDTRNDEIFDSRNQEKYYFVNTSQPFRYYKFNFICNGSNSFQFSEMRIIGQEVPACNATITFSSPQIEANSAIINWLSDATAVGYDVDYKLSTATSWTNVASSITTNSITLTGLTPSTNYDVRVRPKCSAINGVYFSTQILTNAIEVDITNDGGLLTAQYQTGSPYNEDYLKCIDNNIYSKFLTFHCSTWITYKATNNYIVTKYTLTSANDSPERDPRNWSFQASNNGINWVTLNTQSNQVFASRFLTKTYTFANTTPYKYYRFNFTCNNGTIFQVAEITIIGKQYTINAKQVDNLNDYGKIDTSAVLYPNPVSSILDIAVKNSNATTVSVYNYLGDELISKDIKDESNIEINMESFSTGIYLVRINYIDDSNMVYKIVKK